MVASSTYNPLSLLGVHSHWTPNVLVLRDAPVVDEKELKAYVRSGDYFIMLATALDLLSQNLDTNHQEYSDNLQKLVNELMYLQQHYTITQKQPEA